MPVTTPDVDPAVATVVLLLLQVPPVLVLVKVVLAPEQRTAVPDIAAGADVTVTTTVVEQPLPSR
jgi:hypothetical protein